MKGLLKIISCFLLIFINFPTYVLCLSTHNSRALVFVPPMLSSKLQDTKNNNEIVWLDFSFRSLIKIRKNLSYLQFDENGKPLRESIKAFPTKNLNMNVLSDYGVGDCDKKTIQNLEKKFGPKSEYKCDIIRYAYDWRKSCSETSDGLVDLAKKYNELYIVSCSEGGLLVCDSLVKILKDNDLSSRIKCSVFIAVPFCGTLEPLYVFYNGIRLGGWLGMLANFFGIDDITKELSRNLPAMYELLPQEDCYVTKKIKSSVWYKRKTGNLKEFLKEANRFHKNLYIGDKHIASCYNSYFVCGSGIDTMACLRGKDKLKIYKTADGDGTVLFTSSYPIGIDKDKVIKVKNTKHEKMTVSDSVLNTINKILDNNITRCLCYV